MYPDLKIVWNILVAIGILQTDCLSRV